MARVRADRVNRRELTRRPLDLHNSVDIAGAGAAAASRAPPVVADWNVELVDGRGQRTREVETMWAAPFFSADELGALGALAVPSSKGAPEGCQGRNAGDVCRRAL